MADETDFLDLYGKLRLEPGCSLDEFKQAYRRNVAMWHPDRRRGTRADQLAAARLQRLTAQYGAAMDFHRRHGRLPGAPIVARAAVPDSAGVAESESEPAPRGETPFAGPIAVPPRERRMPLITWFAAVGLGVGAVVWGLWPSPYVTEADTEAVAVAARAPAHDAAAVLALGMSPDEVLAVEGEPTRRGEERWEYGPSWVRFEGGVVADWYSSPLRALNVTSTRPAH